MLVSRFWMLDARYSLIPKLLYIQYAVSSNKHRLLNETKLICI